MKLIDYTQPSEAFLRSIDIHELLPQQEPFVMVGRLVAFDRKRTVTQTEVKSDNLFLEKDGLSVPGLMENIAQTCAARIGYVNKYILQKGIQIGFIGAVRNMEVHSLPQLGDTLETTVDVREEVFGMTLADAFIRCGGELRAKTEMKIAVKDR